MNNCGIYQIRNLQNNHTYIGSTIQSFTQRWAQWLFRLRNHKKHNPHLLAAWHKYGEENFHFEILEIVENPNEIIEMNGIVKSKILWREQYWIDLLHPEYNICLVAGNTYGRVFSAETREKMSAAKKGKPLSQEHKNKLSLSRTGRKLSKETREKISLSNTGHTCSEDTRKKISIANSGIKNGMHGKKAWNNGLPPTEETRAKLSLATKGKTKSRKKI